MLPLGVFSSRQFSAVNIVTFLMYGGMGVMFFLVVVNLQVVSGFSPIAAGTALLPVTVLMLLLSARAGALAQKIGPRLPMTAGLVVAAAGCCSSAGSDGTPPTSATSCPPWWCSGSGCRRWSRR